MTFDIALAVVISLNAIFVGVELSLQLSGQDMTAMRVVDSGFLVIYIVEISARFFANGFVASMRTGWVQLDAILIVLGVLCSWVLEPIAGESGPESTAALGPVMILRTLRLLRLGRTVRLFRIFSKIHEFWILVRGFMNGIGLMLCTVVMFALFIYVFACLALELITKHPLNQTDEVFKAHVEEYFGNLPTTMMTLLRFAVLDNTSEVYTPLVKRDPWLFIYFGIVTLIISLIAFNLLAAVIFNTTIEQGVQESDAARKVQEEEWSQLLWDLKRMFLRLDQDGSGQLSREEVQNIHPADMQRLSDALKMGSAMDIFNALDVDGSGELSITEFFDGALDILLSQSDSKEVVHVKRMEKQVETMHWRLKDLFNTQHDLDLRLDKVLETLREMQMGGGMGIRPVPVASLKVPDSTLGSSASDLSELTERLNKIWETTLEQSMQLTLQQVEEVKAKTKEELKARAKKAKAKKGSATGSFGNSHGSSIISVDSESYITLEDVLPQRGGGSSRGESRASSCGSSRSGQSDPPSGLGTRPRPRSRDGQRPANKTGAKSENGYLTIEFDPKDGIPKRQSSPTISVDTINSGHTSGSAYTHEVVV
eukprot:gb/GFBE01013104.1/.p1 GENE.gb/GFBE01013104.1/~~gb/GFBE01013104.1/.p1  ORF type:complete len:596 (+),score=140.22 gb/GFBE01013104.1/:1-1788(+)